jgi:hypothetical protein
MPPGVAEDDERGVVLLEAHRIDACDGLGGGGGRCMLSAALDVGNDNIEGAPRNSPLESAVLIVIVLSEPGCHRGR